MFQPARLSPAPTAPTALSKPALTFGAMSMPSLFVW